MARRKHRPSDPDEIARRAYEARRNPAAWGTNEEALRLAQNTDVHSTAETRTSTRRVQRFDVFAILQSRGALSSDKEQALQRLAAVRRLETDLAIRLRCEGRGEVVAVDNTADMDGYSRRALDAGDRIDAVLEMTGAMSARLLLALCEPSVRDGQPVNNWRAVVERVAGEPFELGQTALVRAACQNLFEAWASYDNRQRRAA